MLSLRMLIRTWRGGELGLILWSLILAVAVVTSVSLLAERIEKALTQESSSFLAADLLVRSSKEAPIEWVDEAARLNVSTAKTIGFASIVFFGDELHLASIKAVQSNYPLRGEIKRSTTPFTRDPSLIESVNYGPSKGEVWVDARLLPLLSIQLGDVIELGDISLKVSQILVEEPDGSSYSFLGARVLMNYADIPASGIIQPGSRVTYRYLMAANDQRTFADYRAWLEPQLDVHDRLITPDQAQASIADTMDKGRRFLLLAGSIGVVLASIALALASHHFASGQTKTVALLKSWGVPASRVRRLYFQQSLWMGLFGSLLGLAMGFLFHHLLLAIVSEWLPIELPTAGFRPWITGAATGLLCLVGFTLPALWHLPSQSPLAVLRQDIILKPLSSAVRVILGVLAIAGLLFWYSNNIYLTLAILIGFGATALASVIAGLSLLRVAMNYGQRMGSVWRLALTNLWRRRSQSLIQMVGFSGAIALLMIMVVVRTSLIDQWQFQLAEDAPNHFLVNVAPYELDDVRQLVDDNQLETAGWYAMVRGRMTAINDELISEAQKDNHESFRRELNLSWTTELPEGNKVAQGQWWDTDMLSEFSAKTNAQGQRIAPVSLEDELAGELGLELGDRITFSVGGLVFEAEMIGTRTLNWDNMTPN
ncbi:MAG: ABC transporter permease, partial [Porticoccaceae bacterium]|nr:ABC transporter permease [Porticoccaceae bacterium]